MLANGIEEHVFHLPNAIEDAQRRLGPYLRCESETASSISPVAARDCPASSDTSQKDLDQTLQQALTELRDREKLNAMEVSFCVRLVL